MMINIYSVYSLIYYRDCQKSYPQHVLLYDLNKNIFDFLINENRDKLFCPYMNKNRDNCAILTIQTKFPEK